ncbi:hypothetical protein FRB96_004399 [Tulasnella sp. 330]|nr:hypothetical protein FRB96_004399 [Tulasnella sp. 330]KAG8884534.1 hypothetical protein FRB97_004047 [Tulasnella sp. 331]
MTSRININRPAPPPSYGQTPYGQNGATSHMGMNGSGMGAGSGAFDASSESPLEKLRVLGSKVEDQIDSLSQPIRPYLPAIGRFLIVVTFLEDALRIVTQWHDQVWYLGRHRGFPWGVSHFFLLVNVIVMLGGSGAIIAKRYTEYAVAGLLAVVVIQGFGYGLIFDLSFFLRNLSVIGGLIMVFSDAITSRNRGFAGLPSLTENDKRKYFQLVGRVLLIFLFIGFMIQGQWTIARGIVSVFGLVACGMIAVGFKAKWSAAFLVILLSIFNVFINNWWSVASHHPTRDFLKYDFFQTLSIVGGLLTLVNVGAGSLSVDEQKKIY